MKILFVCSEATPFASSGGLGDVMGALPKSLVRRGVECSVILPLYDTVGEEYKNEMIHVADISFRMGWRRTGAAVYKLVRDGVEYYFTENDYYYNRGRLYGEADDGERFTHLCLCVPELLKKGILDADIVHANDWHAAMSVVYLKTLYKNSLPDIKTVFTIHNIEYQGKFDPYILGELFGLGEEYLPILEYDGLLNLMKGAMILADRVTTVSESYSEELEYDYYSFGLAPIVRSVKHKMTGIINGIDYEAFSPKRDIFFTFDESNIDEGKRENRKELFDLFGINCDSDVPLAVMITRLTPAKGIDLVLHILEELLSERIYIMILGSGERRYENALAELSERYDNLFVKIGFDRELSKKMYASADLFIMPSASEPCGLAQMIACSYGAVPVVRAVGGLRDSIVPYGQPGALGFRFDNYNAHELLYTIKDALKVYNDKPQWTALRRNAIRARFTWDNSAAKYISIYKNLIQARKEAKYGE